MSRCTPACLHLAQIAEQRQRAELPLGDQAFPGFALVRARPKALPPRCQARPASVDQPLPQLRLFGVAGLGVREEEHVAQTHRAVAVVLGQPYASNLAKAVPVPSSPGRKRLAPVRRPVDGHELGSSRRHAESTRASVSATSCDASHGAPFRARAKAARGALHLPRASMASAPPARRRPRHEPGSGRRSASRPRRTRSPRACTTEPNAVVPVQA